MVTFLCTAPAGRALLALHADHEVKALLGDDYKQVTQSTVHSAPGLLRALARIRTQGFAWESNESIEGVSSVAIAIDTVLGPYAICIVAPTARAVERRELYVDRALRLKETLQAEIDEAPLAPEQAPEARLFASSQERALKSISVCRRVVCPVSAKSPSARLRSLMASGQETDPGIYSSTKLIFTLNLDKLV